LAQRLIHAGERAGRREPGAPSPHAARERRRRSHSLDAGAAARAAHSTTPGRPSMEPRNAAHARRTPSLDRSTIHELAPRPPNPPEPPLRAPRRRSPHGRGVPSAQRDGNEKNHRPRKDPPGAQPPAAIAVRGGDFPKDANRGW